MGFRVNTVVVDGNLTRDPELRSTTGGTSVCSLRIAHNARRKDGATGEWSDVPNYFDVTVWGGEGEWISRNLSKGDKIIVQGELRWREWQAQDGSKRQSVDINASGIVTPPRGASGGSGGGGGGSGDSGFQPRDSDFSPPHGGSGSAPVTAAPADDDIPF